MGITPKLMSVSEIFIVAQICSQSARSWWLWKRIALGPAVVPEVNFKSDGGFFHSVELVVLSGTTFGVS